MTVNAGCTGYRPTPEFEPQEPGRPHVVDGTPLTRLWRSRPVRGPSAPVALDSTNAYLGGSDRRVVAVDLQSGKTRWAVRLAGPLVGGVILADDIIYAATDQPGGKVHALRKVSGNQIWATSTGYVQAPIALTEGRVIVLNRRGEIRGLNALTGKAEWRRRLPSSQVAPYPLGEGRVMVSSFDSLYVVQVSDGRVSLRRHAPGAITSEWVPLAGNLVAGTGDSLVIAIGPDSLEERWRVRLDAPLLVSPAARGDTLFCVTQIGSLYRIVAGDPPRMERLPSPAWAATGAPAVIGSWLLIGGSDGALHAFDAADGTEEWKVLLGRPFEIAPLALADGGFLALGGRGDLHRMKQ